MKVSKIGHTRTGVGKRGNAPKISGGMLYTTPKKTKDKSSICNLVEHIDNLDANARRLYAPFVGFKDIKLIKDKNEKICYNVGNRFNKIIKEMMVSVKQPNCTEEDIISQWGNYLGSFPKKKVFDKGKKKYIFGSEMELKIANDVLDKLIHGYLRNSLRKKLCMTKGGTYYYIPDIVKKLIEALCHTSVESEYHEFFSKISKEEKAAFFKVLYEDCYKSAQKKKIVRSIENQNVKVQVKRIGKGMRLQLSNAEHEKKKYIFEFLKKYAATPTEAERENLMKYIQKLIVLYYFGSEAEKVFSENNGSVWNFKSEIEKIEKFDTNAIISETVNSLINDRSAEESRIKKRELDDKLQNELRNFISERYKESCRVIGDKEEDKFWVQYIEQNAEKLLMAKKGMATYKYTLGYLCESTWEEWKAYIAMKFVDMGKAVYHFAIPDLTKVKGRKDLKIGEVIEEFQEGITSFDYERIKADETIERDLAIYINYAVNNFSRTICSDEFRNRKYEKSNMNNEDVLYIPDERLEIYRDANRRILQFFGGKSRCSDSEIENCAGRELAIAVREEMKIARNSSFHYAAAVNMKGYKPNKMIKKIFLMEYEKLGGVYRKKYYSNNVLLFYSRDEITGLMDRLYDGAKNRPAQIPSFNKIIKRNNITGFIQSFIESEHLKKVSGYPSADSMIEKFRSSLYFILKEIYYYDFLQSDKLVERFVVITKGQNTKNIKNKEAAKNFSKRIKEIVSTKQDVTFGLICQQIMTDYNMQNNEKEIKAAIYTKKKEGTYKHFPMLLYKYIEILFLEYVKENVAFLREPVVREHGLEEIPEEVFCSGWKAHTFDDLQSAIETDPRILSWYTISHFLNQKQLNLLLGCIKNYIQYMENIDQRARDTNNKTGKETSDKIVQYKKLIHVLEFSMLFCGQISNNVSDYFADEEEYASHLANYIRFSSKKKVSAAALKAFCGEKVDKGSPTGTIGLYYDAANPVVNRNVVMSMLYGNEKLLSTCLEKIEMEEIKDYYSHIDKLKEVFKTGVCKDKEEQRALKEFQYEKNRIELTDITIYSEIVNDLMSQLISWAYLRERDLMYFQLGFYYIKLYYTDVVEKNDKMRKLTASNIEITDGAILYQLVSLYSYDVPIYGKGKAEGVNGAFGKKIGIFCKCYSEDAYNAGLSCFENVKEHEEIIGYRNYIDHMKYYTSLDKSILELYSDVYDSFFTYDPKLRKSVSFILKNILERHFIVANIRYQERVKKIEKTGKERAAAQIILSEGGLKSDKLTYKPDKIKSVAIDARSDIFLRQMQKILEYSISK